MLTKYLIIVNVVGFLFYLINMWLYSHTQSGNVDKLLTLISFAGGSAGIIAAILLFDRKPEKSNMMSRVFVICLFLIQMIILLIMRGYHTDSINLSFFRFFNRNRILLYYLCIINIITFVLFAIDKYNAIKHKTRIRIVTLLGFSFIGGSVGGLIAMYLLRHKTKKDYFTVGVPLIIIMQVVVILYVMNAGW